MNDWQYSRNHHQWELTIYGWRATVRRTDQGDAWHTIIERLGSHHERIEGPDFTWPHEGRKWCQEEIARRRRSRRAPPADAEADA
jgi:hypothetical protein